MRKNSLLIILLLLLNMVSVAQVPKPGKPAFVVTFEDKVTNANESLSYSGLVKFSLSNYNEPLRGKGITPEERKLPLDFDPGAFLKLKPGAIIKFYPSEVDESGSGSYGSYTRTLGTDGIEIIVETTDDGTRTIVIDDGAYRKQHGIPSNENFTLNARYYQGVELAELERTASGAILRASTDVSDNLNDWSISQETMQKVFPKVWTFVLTDEDIKSWQQISRTNVVSGSGEDEELTVKLSVKMEVPDLEKPEVTLEGCSEMGVGELEIVTATGKPEGGTYRFWCEPEDLLTIQLDGSSSVVITGAGPGRGTLSVEYTGPGGNTVQASQQAICVKIDNYNGGEPIPQIALFDIDGKKLPGIIKVPVAGEPSRIEELVDFITADNSILTANWLENSVELHGMHQGKTNLQAKTNCGKTTGPTIEVEVVNCDDETVARLEKQRQAATENMQIAAKELQRIYGSPEFEKARNDLVGSTIDLLAKIGLTVVTSLKTPSKIVTRAADLAEAGAAISDLIGSTNSTELGKNAFKNAVSQLGGEVAGTMVGLVDVGEAAERFYKNISEKELHDKAMKSAWERYEKALKAVEEVVRRQEICKRDKTQPQEQEEPKKDKTPETTKPTPPKEPEPKTQTPPAKEQIPEEPTPPEPGDEEPPVPPTTPPNETRQVALPYSPEECGCEESKSISLSSAGFSALNAGLKNLGDCVQKFNSISVADYSNTLKELSALADTLKTAADGDPAIFGVKAEKAKPQLDSLVTRVRSYETAGQTFLKQFDKCPESVSAGMDVLKSAMTVTVDSITTKY